MTLPLISRLGRLGLAFVIASLLIGGLLLVVRPAQPSWALAAVGPDAAQREAVSPAVPPSGGETARLRQAEVASSRWAAPTDMSSEPQGILSTPAVDFVAGTLAPVKVTHGVPVTFRVNVVNTGELNVTLDTSTALEFDDGAGGWFTATLAAATEVVTSTAPNYVQVPLVFSPAAFPAGFLAGGYHPTLHLSGLDGDSQPYTATITSSGNSVTVLDYVTPTLPIAAVAGSLAPTDTIQSEPVSFWLALVNPNLMDITLGPGTTLAFTDSNGLVYAAPLLDAPVLPTSVTTTVEFRLTRVATDTVPGVYTPTVTLAGTDMGGFPIHQSTDLSDTVHVWENMPGLVEVPGTLMPTEPDRHSLIIFWSDFTNTLPCDIALDQRSHVILHSEERVVYTLSLMSPITLPTGSHKRIYFGSGSLTNVPDGVYSPIFSFIAVGGCSPSSFSTSLSSTGTTTILPSTATGGGVGLGPAGGTIARTQYGGAVQLQILNPSTERQSLYTVSATNQCNTVGCQVYWNGLPSGTFGVDPPYVYAGGGEFAFARLFITPDESITRGVEYHLLAHACTASACGSGVCGQYCAQGGYSIYIYDRDGKAAVQDIWATDTFVVRGAPMTVSVEASNPETGSATSPLTVLPGDTTKLILRNSGGDVSQYYTASLIPPDSDISPAATRTILFNATPNLEAPLGSTLLDAELTTRGSYPYTQVSVNCEETPGCPPDSYSGPPTIDITGTVTATDFISPAHIYVVDALLLALAADSLMPATVPWDATGLTLTVRVSNTSDLAFSLAPSSTLSIPFAPRAGLAAAAAGEASYVGVGVWSEPLSLPPHSALMLTFANTDTLEAKADGIYTPTLLLRGVFSDAVGTYDFHQHLDGSGNPVMVDSTPPTAQVEPIGGFSEFPSFVVAWSGSDNVSGIASYDVQVREPGGAWTGWLTGTTALSATFTSPDGRVPYEFRARATDRAGNVGDWSATAIGPSDTLAPAVVLATLPPYSSATFDVSWNGSDDISGIAYFDIQVQADGGEWLPWLIATPAVAMPFTGSNGVSYAFRGRATDWAGNVGDWSVPVNVTVDSTSPTAALEPLHVWSPAAFTLSWSGSDSLSGVASYDVQQRTGPDGDWTDLLTSTIETTALFNGLQAQTYGFRVRATDRIGNVGEWSQEVTTTVDATPPTAAFDSLPYWQPAVFTVSWNGSDDLSGLAGFDVVYDIFGDDVYGWTTWFSQTPATSAVWTGAHNGLYIFLVRAIDNAGNPGAWSPQKWFQVDAVPPAVTIQKLAVWQTGLGFNVSWSGSDTNSGLAGYTVQVKDNDGVWENWLPNTTATSAIYTGSEGHTYGFRARATDSAGNLSDWTATVSTTIDTVAPVAQLDDLPLVQSSPTFSLTWIGSDVTSGIRGYDVQVQQDTGAWTTLHSYTLDSPGPRSGHGWVYDSTRQRFVLWGGWDGQRQLNDTWEFDGHQWYRVTTPQAPPPRSDFGMVYDSQRGRIVLFGGIPEQWVSLNDTWEYDGTTWIRVSTVNAPPSRSVGGMSYDEKRHRTVLFGGGPDVFHLLNDTWEYDGNDWIQRYPSHSPSPRMGGGARLTTYDAQRETVLLHGGWVNGPCSSETWEYDGNDWSLRTRSGPWRYAHGLAYDRDRQRVVLHGGSDCSSGRNDIWEYDSVAVAWAQISLIANTPQYAGLMAYDPVRHLMLTYGDGTMDGGILDTLWAYDGNARVWTEVIPEGVVLSNWDGRSLDFSGTMGHTYAFRVRAMDNAGNLGEWSTTVTTTLSTPPSPATVSPAAGGAGGSDLILSWPRDTTVTAFQVWRSTAPYFTPDTGGVTLIGDQGSPNCTVGETTVTCTDAGALGGVGSYFYAVRVFNGVGLYSDSARVGAFTFGVTPGGP